GLDGGWDKPLRLADMLLYSWDKGLDVCVDLTGSSSLPQTWMVDFVSDRVVIEAAQRKCVKCLNVQILARCHEPNSEGSGSAWKEYVNARVAGLFLLVLLEYPN
nr:hypothetical protein [Tanacetum cinerariifolium]